jgi:hypothetical protein
MSRQYLILCTLAVFVSLGMMTETALGWAGNSHSRLCRITFDDPVVSPLLELKDPATNLTTIEWFDGEPGDYQSGQWSNIAARAYIDTGVSPNGLDWWGLDETTRLKYMQHNTSDVGVPIGHSPASYNPGGFTDTGKEAYLEAQVGTWTDYPSVYGTCNFTNSKTGHSYSFTGSYDVVLNTFYDACRDNMTWSKNHLAGFPYVHDYNDYRAAGWNGTTIALMLQRATFVDYFLTKQSPVALATGADRVIYPGEVVHFSAENSYDPDEITWNSNGTYTNIGTSLESDIEYYWDFNSDYSWDWIDDDPLVDMTYNQLLALGIPTNQWVDCTLWIKDNEGKWDKDVDSLYLDSGGGMSMTPEPASLCLLAVGGLAMIRRKRH